jgi:hypothetical protein
MQGLASNTTDPFFAAKHLELLPFYSLFNAAYGLKFGRTGQRKGDTKRLNQLFKLLSSTKLHIWDIALQAVFLANTPEYTKIFPNGLTAFHIGSIEDRITYLRNAVLEMANYPSLTALHDEIALFLAQLESARSVQNMKATNVKDSKGDLLTKAYNLADEIYGVLGDFMKKFRKDPTLILAFFPIFLLKYRKNKDAPNPDIIELSILSSTTVEAGFNFGHNDSLNLYDTGNTDLILWFAADKMAPKPMTVITLTPQDVKTIKVSDHATQDDRFLMVENPSLDDLGILEISLN